MTSLIITSFPNSTLVCLSLLLNFVTSSQFNLIFPLTKSVRDGPVNTMGFACKPVPSIFPVLLFPKDNSFEVGRRIPPLLRLNEGSLSFEV